MASKLKINIYSAAVQVIVQSIALFILYRYLLVRIGVEQFGVWSVVLATVSSTRLSELGLGACTAKFVSTHLSNNDFIAASEVLQTAFLSVTFLICISFLIFYPLFKFALPFFIPSKFILISFYLLPYAFISLCLSSATSILSSGLDACLRTDIRALIMSIGSLFFLFMAICGVSRYGLFGLVVAQVIQGIFLSFFCWIAVRKFMPCIPVVPYQWKLYHLRRMLSYGLNFQITSIMMLLFEPTTKIFLARFGGLASAGYFEMAQRLITKVRAIIIESNRVIIPIYARLKSLENNVADIYSQNLKNLTSLIIPIFSFLVLLSPAISEILIGDFQKEFFLIFICLSFSWFFNTFSSPAYFAYLGLGILRWVTISHVVMGLFNIVFGITFGILIGLNGCILSFVCSLLIGSFLLLLVFHHEFKINMFNVISRSNFMLLTLCIAIIFIGFPTYFYIFKIIKIDKWLRILIFSTSSGTLLGASFLVYSPRIPLMKFLKYRSHF